MSNTSFADLRRTGGSRRDLEDPERDANDPPSHGAQLLALPNPVPSRAACPAGPVSSATQALARSGWGALARVAIGYSVTTLNSAGISTTRTLSPALRASVRGADDQRAED